MNRHRASLAFSAVLEFPAPPNAAVIAPPGAASRLRVGQDELTPFAILLGQKNDVALSQSGGFLGPERRIVQASIERLESLTSFIEFPCRFKEPPGLFGVNDATGINGLELPWLGPGNRPERIPGYQLALTLSVRHEVIQDGTLPVGRIRGGPRIVLLGIDPVKDCAGVNAAGLRVAERGDGYRRGFQPLDNRGDVL